MEDLTDVHLQSFSKSQFLDPKCVHYSQNDIQKKWECIVEHAEGSSVQVCLQKKYGRCVSCVSILLFNITRNVFVFVKQLRPAVYLHNAKIETVNGKEIINTMKYPANLGITIELCAGIVDKHKPLVLVAQAEVLEECGYNVPEDKLLKVTSFRNATSSSGAVSSLYYAEVTDSMLVSKGGGLASEGELIEVVEMSVNEAKCLIVSDHVNREPGLLFAIQWFLHNIWPKKMTDQE